MAKYDNPYTETINKIKKNKTKIINGIVKDVGKNYQNKIAEIMRCAAKAFYDDYPNPHMYQRHKNPTLANMYHANIGNELYVELGGEFSETKHRVSNDYIYEYMFKEGWHGGAISGNGHPSIGTPWYKNWDSNSKYFYGWNRRAEQMSTETPYDIFMREYNDYMENDFLTMLNESISENFKKFIK